MKKSKFHNIYSFYRTWIDPVIVFISVLAAAFLTFGDIQKEKLPFILFITAILNMISVVIHRKLEPTINKLTKEIESLKTQNELIGENIKNFFDCYLYQLSLKLEFGKNNHKNNERATIYLHDSNNHFIPFVRFSKNPKFHKQGRTRYPDNEGCIAKGWENSWHFENNLGKSDSAYKNNNFRKYNIKEGTLNKITMKSRLYAVKRIDGDNGKHLGVIIIESTDSKRYKEDDLKSKIEQEEKYLAELILILKPHIPSLNNAKERGF